MSSQKAGVHMLTMKLCKHLSSCTILPSNQDVQTIRSPRSNVFKPGHERTTQKQFQTENDLCTLAVDNWNGSSRLSIFNASSAIRSKRNHNITKLPDRGNLVKWMKEEKDCKHIYTRTVHVIPICSCDPHLFFRLERTTGNEIIAVMGLKIPNNCGRELRQTPLKTCLDGEEFRWW